MKKFTLQRIFFMTGILMVLICNPLISWGSTTPFLSAMIEHNWIRGDNFPANTDIIVSIQGSSTVNFTIRTDSSGVFSTAGTAFLQGYSLKRGDAIQASCGGQQASMFIQNLHASVDVGNNLITGTAFTPGGTPMPLSGRSIYVGISQQWGQPNIYDGNTTVDANGSFSLNTGVFDLKAGQKIFLTLNNSTDGSQGNQTHTAPYNGIPYLSANIQQNWISGSQFPYNSQVDVSITTSGATVAKGSFSIQSDSNGNFWANGYSNWQGVSLSIGDVIQATCNGQQISMVIQNLQASVDLVSNSITGTARSPIGDILPGRCVDMSVAPNGGGQFLYIDKTIVQSNGTFVFDLTGKFVLLKGQQININLWDDPDGNPAGNQTSYSPYNGIPFLEAMIEHNWIQCHNFPANTDVSIGIQGGKTANFTIKTDANGYYMAIGSTYWSGYSLRRGDAIQASCGGQQASNMVIQNLHAVADADTNIITGNAFTPGGTPAPLSGRGISIGIYNQWGQSNIYNGNTTVNANGSFSLNTGAFDLKAGQKIFLSLTDSTGGSQGNKTDTAPYNGMHLFSASLNNNSIQGLDFPGNSPLTLSINSNPALTAVIQVDGNGNFNKNVHNFQYLLKAGDVITILYGAEIYGAAKVLSYTIPSLTASVDTANNVISGVAPEFAGKSLQITVFSSSIQVLYQTTVSVNSDGSFSITIDFDLVPGQGIVISAPDTYAGITIYNGVPSIEGSVSQIHYFDGSLKTRYDIYTWPDSNAVIDSITVTGPNGPLPYTKNDFSHDLYDYRSYWMDVNGSPEIGIYTFTVKSGSLTVTVQDTQSINREIPNPELVLPAANATLYSKTPVFEWSPVSYPNTQIYYRLVIDDMTGYRVVSTSRNSGMLSYAVPQYVLKPGQTYRFQVRASDNDIWTNIQNEGRSEWRTFTMGTSLQLAATFDGLGLWIYNLDSATWTRVSSANPENMIYSGSTLYADFGASLGLYKLDGAAWTQLTSANPENMATSDSTLYVDFGAAYGLYKWDGALWTQLTSTKPENMAASGSTLYVDFGASYGLWNWNGSAWSQLTTANPGNMVTSGSTLYVDFGAAYGLYKWDGASWTQLTSTSPENMVTSGSTLYVDFGAAYGLWNWNGASWAQLTPANPENMLTSSGSTLYVDFGAAYGLYKWDGASWAQLTLIDPKNMVTSGSSLCVDFGAAYGLYKWNGSIWSQLTGASPVIMAASN